MSCGGRAGWYVPRRYVLAALGFLGMFNLYAMRVNLSVAMVAMVNDTGGDVGVNGTADVECAELLHPVATNDYKGERYSWGAREQGLILSSFFYGYVVTQVPGGMLSERVGAKWLFGGGILITALLTILTPLAASSGIAPFIVVRVLEGLGEGVTFPAVNVAISNWSPRDERSRLSTLVFTGAQIGNVVSMPVSGYLCSSDALGGWPSVFYLFGSIGALWFLLWTWLIHETPRQHPSISKEELLHIEQNREQIGTKLPIPWGSVFSSLPMWAVIVAHIGHNFGFLILLTELPTYLSGILHFDIQANGVLSALPYVVQAISAWLCSFAADKLRRSGTLSITNIRKIFNSIGLTGPALCLLGVTASGCNSQLIVALFSMALALNGAIYSGFNVTHVDMSPELAGTLFGITNAISNVSGILGPVIVGACIQSGSTIANWSKVFYLAAGLYIGSAIFYAVFASAELQPWGSSTSAAGEAKTEKDKAIGLGTIKQKMAVDNCR